MHVKKFFFRVLVWKFIRPYQTRSIYVCIYIFLGYEISGLENIPSDSPVLFIYYHGALPIDMYYFIAKLYLCRNRLIHTVADRLLFKIPGTSTLSKIILKNETGAIRVPQFSCMSRTHFAFRLHGDKVLNLQDGPLYWRASTWYQARYNNAPASWRTATCSRFRQVASMKPSLAVNTIDSCGRND